MCSSLSRIIRSTRASISTTIEEVNRSAGSARNGGKTMRAGKLLVQITLYYVVIGMAIFVALKLWPEIRGYLPVGGVEQLIAQPAKNPLEASEAVRAAHVANLGQSIFWLIVAILAALVVSLPVSWVYMAVRSGEEYDQSLVNTIIVLPMVVTGIVIIVQNSLALAFALAGIAGAVRFRNSLAGIISIAFNYCFVVLWITEYGEREGMKRFLTDYDGVDRAVVVEQTVAVVEEKKS